MITPKNVVRHELIGLEAEVVASANPSQVGAKGEIVNETKNTLTLARGEKTSMLEKRGLTVTITLPDKKRVKVSGDVLLARPEDRIKTKIKKW